MNGFRFSGCHFENGSGNTECSSFSDFGYGIFANSSGFTVSGQCLDIFFPCTNYNRTTFKGLGVGIHTQSTTKNRPYVVKQADFEDCFFGIYQNLVDGATIVNNNFYMGDLPSSNCTGNQIGVALQDFANGLTVQENLFFSNGGNASNTIGTSATLTWEFNNVIRRNTYNGVTYGNIAGGRNAVLTEIPIGLNYECNTNINVSQYDFLVSELPGFSPNNIRNKQGLLTGLNTFSASGNKFSYTGSPSDSDFGNQGGWIIDLEYFFDPLGVNETPIDFSDITPEDVTANPCLIAYCDPPCKYPNEVSLEKQRFYNYKNVFNTAKSNYLAAVNSGNTTLASIKANEAGYARQEMDRSGHMVLLHIMYDTLTYHRDTLRRWLGNFETYSTDLALARDYVDAGQFVEAETVLNNIPTKYVLDANDLMDLQATISIFALINQKTLYGMSEADFPFLTSLAFSVLPHTSSIAKSILELYDVEHFPPLYALESGERSPKDNAAQQVEKEFFNITMFPNPANDFIIMSWNRKLENGARLTFHNNTGRLVLQRDIPEGSQSLHIEKVELPVGVYFYQISSDSAVINYGKLVIQK